MLWGGRGSFSLCLIFLFSSWKCTPWAFDQSCEHLVSPHNLSLKAIIIIRSLRLSHRGNMRSAFIRQMEHGWSGPQWASGYITVLYEMMWMIDRDNLNLGQDRVTCLEGWDVDRKESKTGGGRRDDRCQCRTEMPKRVNKDEYWCTTKNIFKWTIFPSIHYSLLALLPPLTFSEWAVVKNTLSTGPSQVMWWLSAGLMGLWWDPGSLCETTVKYHSSLQRQFLLTRNVR